MTTIDSPRFALPATPSDGAWCLAVALIERADFNQETAISEILLSDLFPASEQLDIAWKEEMGGRACKFNIVVYKNANFEESAFDSINMFCRLSYRNNPNRIVAEFNPYAQCQLHQMQASIRQLAGLHQLRPTSLNARLKLIAPLTVFNMKKQKHYKGAAFAGLMRPNEQVVTSLPNLLGK